MEFLNSLGFDPIMLGAQILNFLIIFYLLKRFLYKPVMNMIKTREDKIAEGLKQAEEARIKLEQTLEEEKKILTKAQLQAKEIIDQSREQALANASIIQEQAQASANKIIAGAKTQMEQEAQEIERKLSEKIGIIAADMLTKSLKGLFNEKEQKAIVNKALKDIKDVN